MSNTGPSHRREYQQTFLANPNTARLLAAAVDLAGLVNGYVTEEILAMNLPDKIRIVTALWEAIAPGKALLLWGLA